MPRFPVLLSVLLLAFALADVPLHVLTTASSSGGTVYYVGKTSCSDTGPGNASTPFCTLARGVAVLQPGDTLIIYNGTYEERLWVRDLNGSEADPIVIEGESAQTVILNGGCPSFPCNITQALWQDTWGWNGLASIGRSSNVTLRNLSVQNTVAYGIGVWGSSGVTIDGVAVDGVGNGGLIIDRSTDVSVVNTEITHTNMMWIDSGGRLREGGQEALSIIGVDGFFVADNHVHDVLEEGIDVKEQSTRGEVRDNLVERACTVGIYINEAHNVSVYRNLVPQAGYYEVNGSAVKCSDIPYYGPYFGLYFGNGLMLAVGDLGGLSKGTLSNIELYKNVVRDAHLNCLQTWDELRSSGKGKGNMTAIRIYDNAFTNCGENRIGGGMRLSNIEDSVVSGNFVDNGSEAGITGGAVRRTSFTGNRVSNSGSGIYLSSSPDLMIIGNSITDNGYAGIHLSGSHNSTIFGNNISRNDNALGIFSSRNVSITENRISSSRYYGAYLKNVSGALVSHNSFISNSVHAYDDRGPENAWDDGYPSGGNYWSDYGGVDQFSGPSQDQAGSDEIGDTPYVIDGDNEDRYPLMVATDGNSPPAPLTMLPAQLAGPGNEDVLLSWSPSPDDGGGENDIVGYEVWVGETYNATTTNYRPLAFQPPGTTSYVHRGAGVGDSASYFYDIRAIDSFNQTTSAVEQAGKYAQPLAEGLHLISVPLEQVNWSIYEVLQTVPWTRAWTFLASVGQGGSWVHNDRGKTWADLTALDRRMAVWLDISSDAWWVTAGLVVKETQITLRSGWNLMGYPSFTPRLVEDVLSGVDYRAVEGFVEDPPYYLRPLAPSELMVAGSGQWVHLGGADTLITIEN